MAGTVTVSVLSERQDGKIGDDWKYDLEVKVFNEGLKGKGQINVPKHNLADGVTVEPHGNPDPLVLDAGEPGSELKIWMKLVATEVDLFQNDQGESDLNFTMPCPNPGDAPIVFEKEISCGVTEKPVVADSTAIFTLEVKLVASAD
ncbi:MAG: hypothetical protein HKO64_09510 [Xanthomonadales bacterium]|nr:hypothetical protein [Xanthomonadales bacterium]NNL95845.1 hypothetical protein [Xanthomonadales bacterium]